MAPRRDGGGEADDNSEPQPAVTEMKLRMNPNIRVRLNEPPSLRDPAAQRSAHHAGPPGPERRASGREPGSESETQAHALESDFTEVRLDDPQGSAVRGPGYSRGEAQAGGRTSQAGTFSQAPAPGGAGPVGAGTLPRGNGDGPQNPSADPYSSPASARSISAAAKHRSLHGIGGLGITALHRPGRPSQAGSAVVQKGSSLGQAGSPMAEKQSLLGSLTSLFQGTPGGTKGGGWFRVSGGEPASLGAGELEWEGRAEGRTLAGLTRGAPGDASFGGGLYGLESTPPWESRTSSHSRSADSLGKDSHELDHERGALRPPKQGPLFPGEGQWYTSASPVWSQGVGHFNASEYMNFTRHFIPVIAFVALNALGGTAVLVLVALGMPALAIGIAAGAWALLLGLNLSLAFLPRLSLRQAVWAGRGRTLRQLERKLVEEPFLPVVLHGRIVQASSGGLDASGHVVSDQGAVVMETVLQQCGARQGRHFFGAKTLVRQTRATDFVIQDREGRRTAVRARCASDAGALTALVHHEDAIPLASSHRVTGFLDAEWLDNQDRLLSQRPDLQAADLVVCRGMIVEGQSVAVMGALRESMGDPGNLVIEPLPVPFNASPLLLGGCLPFCYPSWVSGLVVADNPDNFT